jgi:hypothetical protein
VRLLNCGDELLQQGWSFDEKLSEDNPEIGEI